MDAIMHPNLPEVYAINQTESITHKSMDQWLQDRHVDSNNQQQISPICKYENNTTNLFNDISVVWWKGTSTTDVNIQMQHQNRPTIVNYPSLENIAGCQPINVSQNNSVDEKKFSKLTDICKIRNLREEKEIAKRAKHPEKWKVNIKKNARLRGEEYVGVGGKVVPAKIMGPPCQCRMHCAEKIDEIARKKLHSVFWKTCTWEQRKQYIALSVKESPKQRTRCRGKVKSEHRRQVTFTYSLLLNGEFVTVCKCMFLSTFSVSEKFVRHVMNKKRTSPGGIIGPDQRGRHTPKTKKNETIKDRVREHINSFPVEKSTNSKDCSGKQYLDSKLSIAAMHKLYVSKCKEENVPETEIVKESYYREMFKTEFNLGFKRVKSRDKEQSPIIDKSV